MIFAHEQSQTVRELEFLNLTRSNRFHGLRLPVKEPFGFNETTVRLFSVGYVLATRLISSSVTFWTASRYSRLKLRSRVSNQFEPISEA